MSGLPWGGVPSELLAATGNSATFRIPPGVPSGLTTVTAANPGGHTGSIGFLVKGYISVADAGPDQAAFINSTVELDGSGSTGADGDPLRFRWSFVQRPPGSAAALNDPTTMRPSFGVDLPGRYIVQLIVNDGTAASPPDTAVIDTYDSQPVANAGPNQVVLAGDTVRLAGSGVSDPGTSLTFAWSLASLPDGSLASLSDPTLSSDLRSGCSRGLPGSVGGQ